MACCNDLCRRAFINHTLPEFFESNFWWLSANTQGNIIIFIRLHTAWERRINKSCIFYGWTHFGKSYCRPTENAWNSLDVNNRWHQCNHWVINGYKLSINLSIIYPKPEIPWYSMSNQKILLMLHKTFSHWSQVHLICLSIYFPAGALLDSSLQYLLPLLPPLYISEDDGKKIGPNCFDSHHYLFYLSINLTAE